MKKRRLVTSALPYVNNIPHLGNLIQVLSADVFARFCRIKGYETLYICGTDEYGTATETKALQENMTPKQLCDHYHVIHRDIYSWFNIEFDNFGRTSDAKQTEIVQSIFNQVDAAGFIREAEIEQLYCTTCDRFLADRYVHGVCPHCGYEDARGDQCENCGKLLDPTDLIKPVCGVCGSTPESRSTRHLYLKLPEILPMLQEWMDEASVKGFWARNAVQMTKSWIRDGLKERCITRDLKWGIPVPKEGFEDKVFYVWFDAPIGYISMTADHTDQWESWWKNPDEVELFQFIGKDNIPFHTVIFPSTQLATGQNWTMLHHMSSSEYLNYETGKFSKSKGVGVFGTDAKDTGIPADVWRFYIFYNRPEKSDYTFTWADFQEKVNGELIGNLANLVNRTLTFLNKFYDGKIPAAQPDTAFARLVAQKEEKITAHLERAELRDALREIFALSSAGNKAFQDGQPWAVRKTDPAAAGALLMQLSYLVRDLAILIEPYMPESSDRILAFFNEHDASWDTLGTYDGLTGITQTSILFEKLEDEKIEALRTRFAGTQEERKRQEEQAMDEESLEVQFNEQVDLRVAVITDIKQHPEADKLYIETIDVGDEEPRQIVSGLVPHYTEEQLLGKHIIVVYNLKPAKLRGAKSQGMLLAASAEDSDGNETVEVLFAPWAQPGDRLTLSGLQPVEEKKRIKADAFFAIPIRTEGGIVKVGETQLEVAGRALSSQIVLNGEVG